ncbi:hypothetical protein [Croceibacterium xixiisoli]|uniref:hypothetical protein n=1 Tax=Croceibacterium xixiisoli TaxID=1476466 RepID=UPI0013680517|nr:hypothetical protein [Croceibacterium xixiisoli]
MACAALYGGWRFWFHEEPRASGPLAAELLAHVAEGGDSGKLTATIDAHIPRQTPLDARLTVLERNGFDCAIRPARVAGSRELSCRRPVEGQRYCQRINYFAYQTGAGEILESLAALYKVSSRQMVWGRCPYEPPSVGEI